MQPYWIVDRTNESIRLYCGEFESLDQATAILYGDGGFNSRDWRVSSVGNE
jgi:hypothetical protein